jgi:prepilin-type N-terminal cleavage/methylation domain-containing protein/prepilin-type processing-associated H-X9-DG protein
MKHMPSSTPRGFTLVELLAVIAIIGILAAILVPTLGKVRLSAQKSVDAGHLREIGRAALLYASEHNDRLPDPVGNAAGPVAERLGGGTAVFVWMGLLAKDGKIEDPALFYSKADALHPGTLPSGLLDPTAPGSLHPDLATTTPSFEFVGGIKLTDKPTTPIAFTRGLKDDGTWDADRGVYGADGGYVLFLDGHVEYFKSLAGRVVQTNGHPSANLGQAVPRTANQRLYGKGGSLGTEAGAVPPAPST